MQAFSNNTFMTSKTNKKMKEIRAITQIHKVKKTSIIILRDSRINKKCKKIHNKNMDYQIFSAAE